jgi:hypothetical protein
VFEIEDKIHDEEVGEAKEKIKKSRVLDLSNRSDYYVCSECFCVYTRFCSFGGNHGNKKKHVSK